jgi:photosystem II stability/assembly factor-like uncharacterized protein
MIRARSIRLPLFVQVLPNSKMQSLFNLSQRFIGLCAVALLCFGCASAFLPAMSFNPWQVISLPTDQTLLDIAFTSDRNHGWLVGSNNTLLESLDAGKTWQRVDLDLGEQKYRLNAVSFSGQDGWVVGEPALLLHTSDGGDSWENIPLSARLPGVPNTITALGQQSAEMTTDVGAIYRTADGGRNWKALVQSAVGVIRNIARSPEGKYIAVSAKGNFYSIWEPGMEAWEPHNRNSSRRVQSMGFAPDGRLWMLTRGGQLQFSKTSSVDEWDDPINPEISTSWGFLDLTFRTTDEIWVSGGSGNLIYSPDQGATWQKDLPVEDVPSNLYRVIFQNPEQGFIIGQRGTLLRYEPGAAKTA